MHHIALHLPRLAMPAGLVLASLVCGVVVALPEPLALNVEGVAAPVVGVVPTPTPEEDHGGPASFFPRRVGWELQAPGPAARGVVQSRYQLCISPPADGADDICIDGTTGQPHAELSAAAMAAVMSRPDAVFGFGVRWWAAPGGGDDAPSHWANSSFTTGLWAAASKGTAGAVGAEDPWRGARWIGAGKGGGPDDGGGKPPRMLPPGLWLRKPFTLPAGAARATLYVAHASFYKCAIDGVPVDNHELGATTNWWHRLYYNSVCASSTAPPPPQTPTPTPTHPPTCARASCAWPVRPPRA